MNQNDTTSPEDNQRNFVAFLNTVIYHQWYAIKPNLTLKLNISENDSIIRLCLKATISKFLLENLIFSFDESAKKLMYVRLLK